MSNGQDPEDREDESWKWNTSATTANPPPAAKPRRAASEGKAERRANVARLLGRRVPHAQIAQILGVSKATISTDVEAIRTEMAKELSSHTVVDVAARYIRGVNERERELWVLYDQAKNGVKKQVPPGGPLPEEPYLVKPNRMLAKHILTELRASSRDELEALQALGIVHKAPVELSITLRAQELMRAAPSHLLDALNETEDPEEFRRLLGEIVGEDLAMQMVDPPVVDVPAPKRLLRGT